MFRYPLEDGHGARRFYERGYSEGAVTELPDARRLAQMVDSKFVGSPYDFSEKIGIVKLFKGRGCVLDYGSSWGYHTYQLRAAGFDALGFEISTHRRKFGRDKLGVNMVGAAEDLDRLPPGSFDIIVANHVLEHLPALAPVLNSFRRLIREDGLLVVFVPNCAGRNAREQGASWGPMIGEKHPLALDRRFFDTNLPKYRFEVRVTSDPYDLDAIGRLFDEVVDPRDTDGDELMVLGRAVGPGSPGR
jgi:SAM-dependent methyltransferase